MERYMLMLLYAAKGKIRGKLWLQKEMFELSKNFPELADELDFDAYNYGPFSEGLEEYRDMLENSGLILGLELTDKGRKIAEDLWKCENEENKEIIKGVVEFLENLEKDELLLYIYAITPEMAERSDVKEKILQRRLDIALRMLKNGKISTGLAAKLAGIPYNVLLDEALKQGIKPFDIQGDEADNN
ncbi:MAG: hypothetical protein RMI79_07180 [Nitrososphaerota archaeon]|nr:hypothetical protein [Nitrososphaerota archaeon]